MRQMKILVVYSMFLKWSDDKLSNRTVTAYLNDESASKEVDNGTPQGGILSTDYWNGDGDEGRIPIVDSDEILLVTIDGDVACARS